MHHPLEMGVRTVGHPGALNSWTDAALRCHWATCAKATLGSTTPSHQRWVRGSCIITQWPSLVPQRARITTGRHPSSSLMVLFALTHLNSLFTMWDAPVNPREKEKKKLLFGFTDTVLSKNRDWFSSFPLLFFFSSSFFPSSYSSFLFFFFNKTSIFVPELSETAELVKAVNRTGPFYLLEIWRDLSATELAPMAGSSATVNGKAGKYIITSGLSLPEGFTVNYSIQGKQAGGKRRQGVGWGGLGGLVGQMVKEGGKKSKCFFFKRLTRMVVILGWRIHFECRT